MAVFECLPFDQLSAIELAIITKDAIDPGKKKGGSTEPWGKIKFDRQIVANSQGHRRDGDLYR
jgi:hypothetical protein